MIQLPPDNDFGLSAYESDYLNRLHTERYADVHVVYGFARRITYRIYTEFCCETDSHLHIQYKGEACRQWIDDETLYACERAHVNSHDAYESVRDKVLRAIAFRAYTLFSAWNAYSPSPGNPMELENLRCDLLATGSFQNE